MIKRYTSIGMNEELYDRVQNLLSGNETVNDFAYKALEQRVNRMEVRDKKTREDLFKKNVKDFTPVIKQVLLEAGLI